MYDSVLHANRLPKSRMHRVHPWGHWNLGVVLGIATVNMVFIIVKGSMMDVGTPGEWRGLLVCYALEVVWLCIACARMWRPASAAQYLEAEVGVSCLVCHVPCAWCVSVCL
jgi:hypothetical protein